MNSRITILFFGLLLSMLWLFGVMIAQRRTGGDLSYIAPSLHEAGLKIDKVVVRRTDKDNKADIVFVKINDLWYLRQDKQQVKVEGNQIDKLVAAVRDAKPDDTADVSKDAKFYGLDNPSTIVTLSGTSKDGDKEVKFFVGKTSPDKGFTYVTSSDKDNKNFAVLTSSIEKLMFKNANYLRQKRLYDFVDSSVSSISIKKEKEKQELAIKRADGNTWMFIKPNLGIAGFSKDSDEPKNLDAKGPAVVSVKSLLDAIVTVRVDDDDDFIPLGSDHANYGLETGKALMQVDIHTVEKKEAATESLLIGERVKDKSRDYYYARVASDDGVMKINARWIEPIEAALKDPGKIRSKDITAIDAKSVDAVVVKQQGKDEIRFLRPEGAAEWQMHILKVTTTGTDKDKKTTTETTKLTAHEPSVTKLLEQVVGRQAIVDYNDVGEADAKKKDAEWGLDTPIAEISVYLGGVEKTDEKKKEPGKDDAPAKLKADAKAAVTLAVGKIEKEIVHIRRKLDTGAESRLTVKKEFVEKTLPTEGVELAYAALTLPKIETQDLVSIRLQRSGEKGPEVLELEEQTIEGKYNWFIKDALEPSGVKLADAKNAGMLTAIVADLRVKKWLRKLEEKDDLDKYGLKTPAVVVTAVLKKPATDKGAVSLVGLLQQHSAFAAAAGLIGNWYADTGEAVTIEFGKETTDEKDKPGIFARHSKSKNLLLVGTGEVKAAKELDLRDRTYMLAAHAEKIASLMAAVAGDPMSAWMLTSPYLSGTIHSFDADKVKEIKLAVRTQFELRGFHFEKNAKDKTWNDKSNLQEFQLDSEKVASFAKEIAKLHTPRFAATSGGPRGEHKLSVKDATVRLEMTLDDGRLITLLVGGQFSPHGYFANTSYWPETVFFIPEGTIIPILRGAAHFAKERLAGN